MRLYHGSLCLICILCLLSCFFVSFGACSSTPFEGEPNDPQEQILPPPEFFAEGWPHEVATTASYIACDFSSPCATQFGSVSLVQDGGGIVAFQKVWSDSNRRLMLYPQTLPPGKYILTVGGFRTSDGRHFKNAELEFCVIQKEDAEDKRAPAVVSQVPRDQDFAVSPSLHRIAIRFNKAIDLAAVEFSVSDGDHEVNATLDMSVAFSDLFVLNLKENLKGESFYILTLMNIRDSHGNTLPIHILLFATAADTAQDIRTGLVEHLVISEVCYGGYKGGSATDEFIDRTTSSKNGADITIDNFSTLWNILGFTDPWWNVTGRLPDLSAYL